MAWSMKQFAPLSDISQGSVATQLKCRGIFSDGISAINFLIETVKQFRKNGKYLIKLRRTKIVPFLGHPVEGGQS